MTMLCKTVSLLVVAMLTTAISAETKIGFRQVTSTYPVAVQRGTTAEVQLRSNFTLDETYEVLFANPGITMTFLEEKPIAAPRGGRGSVGTPFRFQVTVPKDQSPGVYEYRVATKQAVSSVAQLMVTDYVVVEEEKKENGTVSTAQKVDFPVAICGTCDRFEDVDCFTISAKAGQELTFQIFAQRVTDRIHSMVVRGPKIYLMDSILTLISPTGQVVAQNDNFIGGDSFISFQVPQDGDYTLEVRDARYAGNGRYTYCVEISDRPYIHSLFPMAVQQGTSSNVSLVSPFPKESDQSHLLETADKTLGWQKVRIKTASGLSNLVPMLVSPHPQFTETEGNNSADNANKVTLPVGINGRLSEKDDVDFFTFGAKKGELFRFEVHARRQGSPIDSVLEIYNASGKLLAEADDLVSHKTKDSRLDWKAPSDGDYSIAVRDLHGRGGSRFVYHLEAAAAEPDFELSGEYYYAMLAPGTRMIWFARIQRLNGFDGPVVIEIENLPEGVTYTPVTIPTGMKHCGIILSADKEAKIAARLVRAVGKANIAGSDGTEKEIVRYGHVTCEQQSSGGGQARWLIDSQIVGVTKPLDLVSVTVTPTEITLQPGGSAEIDVHIERTAEFKDPVSLAMSFDYASKKIGEQLPPGIKVSGKSKLRLTGDTLDGKIILEASDKALPVQKLPIAAIARVSITFSITTNYASNPIYLTIEPKKAK